ncbi:MAG: quinoprotein relay system zinc metallohydrolase 2 [Burkholderiales bacterium]
MAVILFACAPTLALADAPGFNLTEIAPGIFVHQGKMVAERTPANMGDQANIGFIVGEKCVATLDAGGSIKVGLLLREAIKKTTDKPICYVINSHVHPDHMFGNAAFKADNVTFIGHERLAKAAAARNSNYTNSLKRDLGDAANGSELTPPTQTVKAGETLELDLGGRMLIIQAWPVGHTDNDISVLDEQTQTLWLGDLLFMEHVPAMDGSIPGWLKVIAELKKIPAKIVIPGHGPATAPWPSAVEPEERYLTKVADGVRKALKEKQTIQEAIENVGWDEKDKWQQFENFHRRTVTATYAELEWED